MAFLLCSTLLPSCPAAMAVRISARPSVTTACFPLGWFIAVSFEPVTLKVRRNASQELLKRFCLPPARLSVGQDNAPQQAPWQATSYDIRLTRGACRRLSFLSLKL